MIHLDVRADVRKAQIFLRATEQGAKRATARALNRTIVTVRADAARLLQEKRALPIGEIKKAMRLVRATARNPVAAVVVSGKPIPLRRFATAIGHYRGSHGVSIRIEKGTKRSRLIVQGRKAFVNPKWNPNVFARTGIVYGGKRRKQQIKKRPPVPGLPTVLVQDRIVAALRAVVAREFPKRMAAELNYEINVARRGAAR